MTSDQKFCTECGASLVPGTRFCGRCGHPVAGQIPPDPSATLPAETPVQSPHGPAAAFDRGQERITGIVPFVEQGLLSVIHYTLLITPQRLIFCTWNPDTDEEMSDADDDVTQESCEITDTKDEIAHFHAKDWATGPWQRYLSVPIESITAGAPGSISIPIATIEGVDIICEKKTSTQDKLYVEDGGRVQEFDLMHSQGPYLFGLLQPVLGERVRMADHLHRRGKLDRLLSGQEYQE